MTRRKERMRSSPWLYPAFGNAEAFGNIIKLLKSVLNLYSVLVTLSDSCLKFLKIFFFNDKNDPIKTRSDSVKY